MKPNHVFPVYSPEDGGTGGTLAAAAGAASPPPPPLSPPPTGGGDGGWKPPAGLPEAFSGSTADEVLGKLLGGYSDLNTRAEGLRTELARRPKAPDKPESYTFKPSEKLAPYFGEGNKSLDFVRQAAHKHGIPDTAFGPMLEDIYGPMVDAGLIPPPFNPQKEIDGFSKATGLDRQGVAGALNENLTFAKGLVEQLKGVPEASRQGVTAALLALTDTADGNVLIRALAGRLNEAGIRVAGDPASTGGYSEADLQKLTADPRIDPRNRDHADPDKRYDPQLREQYDQLTRRVAAARKPG